MVNAHGIWFVFGGGVGKNHSICYSTMDFAVKEKYSSCTLPCTNILTILSL